MNAAKKLSLTLLVFAPVFPAFAGDVPAPGQSVTNAIAPRTFAAKGVVRELKPDGRTVVIQHEEIPGYMGAMTMPFEARDTNELKGLQPGDAVTFRMVVTDRAGWIDGVKKVEAAPAALPQLPAGAGWRVVRDVPELRMGDELPEYHFTNELGRAMSTREFKGQALVFTFFFTRCPFPNFCPYLSRNFDEVQAKLLAAPDGPTNWHLLSISFDTQVDTPAVLKTYAEAYHYQPAHWSFLTGRLEDIDAIADQVGEYFGHDETGGVTHNLRTVVVNAAGRVQRIFTDNRWTGDELMAEIVKAARAK